MSELKHFNIRVYGILINEKQGVLLSDEYCFDQYMTKFPGGGLKFGEGPEECLLREAREEFNQDAEIIDHFYTTGFYQKAYFFEDHQLISIYYRINLKSYADLHISRKAFDFPAPVNGSQSFRWAAIESLSEKDLSFPVDRFVLNLLKEKLAKGEL